MEKEDEKFPVYDVHTVFPQDRESLRDWFAGMAMHSTMNTYVERFAIRAEESYRMADAMLKEREKVSEGGENNERL